MPNSKLVLINTKDKGMILNPNDNLFDCWVHASHAADWTKEYAMDDDTTARSRMGYKISYADCPMLWASKMQTEIALSSIEAEYVALSQAMREVIPLMELMKEAQEMNLPITPKIPRVHCRIF